MHRRFLKSLATVMGAAALIVAPMALLAPSAHAAVIELNEDNADDAVPTVQGRGGTNSVTYWVDYLADKGIEGATCVKEDDVDGKTWTIPPAPEGTEYVLVTSKAANENALEDGQFPNQVWWAPKAAEGNIVTAVAGKNISHIIWCTVPTKTTPPPTTTPPTTTPPVTTPPASTPPVVDTDRVATTGSGAGLGLYGAAAALLVGAGAIVLGRRRQGAHR